MMENTILKFQSYISIVIIEKIINQQMMQYVIQVMDIFYNANLAKPAAQRVAPAEFYNDALNNEVDLRKQAEIFYREWSAAKRHNKTFDRHSFFTLYNYPWTLNAYRKAELFRIIASQTRHEMIGQAILQNMNSFFSAGNTNSTINTILNSAHFTLKVRRANILEDSLNGIVMNSANQ